MLVATLLLIRLRFRHYAADAMMMPYDARRSLFRYAPLLHATPADAAVTLCMLR